jgi:23S rRNA (cytidine1920-2'-O)/16S rRNA (cytidine1409-2'-O)-methyltransferase
VDVGREQLHASLRADPRVISMEGRDARALEPAMFASPPQIVVCDASFISLRLILPNVLPLAGEGARLVALIKPQFEAGRENVGKGVIVRDRDIHARVCEEIAALVRDLGWRVDGVRPSPIEGGDGNCEFLIGATRCTQARP